MPYKRAHAPIYGYLKGVRHTIPLHAVWFARTWSIMRLLNRVEFSSVLNVGGADGLHSRMLTDFFGAQAVTLDLCSDFLLAGKEVLDGNYVCADARRLPFADNQFDLVLCVETIEHVPEPERMVAELKRVAAKYVMVSTESFFDSSEQRSAFLDYLRETHPQFFRAQDPEEPYDVNHFTMEDLHDLLGPQEFAVYPQYDRKRQDISGSIDEVRALIREMTEVQTVNRVSKFIGLVPLSGAPLPGNPKLEDNRLLERIVTDEPFVDPGELDESMRREDAEVSEEIVSWHCGAARPHVYPVSSRPVRPIEEEGAHFMDMQRITGDVTGLPVPFCLRQFTLGPDGTTPWKCNDWEHHVYVLEGEGEFLSGKDRTPLTQGSCIWIAPKARHRFTASDSGLVFLDVIPSVYAFFGR